MCLPQSVKPAEDASGGAGGPGTLRGLISCAVLRGLRGGAGPPWPALPVARSSSLQATATETGDTLCASVGKACFSSSSVPTHRGPPKQRILRRPARSRGGPVGAWGRPAAAWSPRGPADLWSRPADRVGLEGRVRSVGLLPRFPAPRASSRAVRHPPCGAWDPVLVCSARPWPVCVRECERAWESECECV